MNYQDALKKAGAVKLKDNFMSIKTNYDKAIILPYKDGIQFMAALTNAEQLNNRYNEQASITEFDRETFEIRIMSGAEYLRYKIAALLGIKPEEVKALETPPKEEAIPF